MNKTEPTLPIIIMPINKVKKTCLCCGKQFEIFPYVIQNFCDRCYPIVCKEIFDNSNEKLTCKQLKDKIKKELE